jgi:diadenosine tetraphosphatase ApaH/serine/threonine PP2A family protein phosphatase
VTRHIFIGDIHGCFDELQELLARLQPVSADVVVALGDFVRKGPAADRCLDLWRERGYRAVMGNNDAKLVRRAGRGPRRWIAPREDRAVMRRAELVEQLRAAPLALDFPEVGLAAVHAGILPNGRRFGMQLITIDAALELRQVRRAANGEWRFVPRGREQRGDRFWADVWEGDRTVVYGHTPRREARIDARAVGIDTGCVYGGKLTAAVFDGAGGPELVSVAARRRYAR